MHDGCTPSPACQPAGLAAVRRGHVHSAGAGCRGYLYKGQRRARCGAVPGRVARGRKESEGGRHAARRAVANPRTCCLNCTQGRPLSVPPPRSPQPLAAGATRSAAPPIPSWPAPPTRLPQPLAAGATRSAAVAAAPPPLTAPPSLASPPPSPEPLDGAPRSASPPILPPSPEPL